MKGELERELVGPGELEQSWKGGNLLLGVGRGAGGGAGNMSLKGELEWELRTGGAGDLERAVGGELVGEFNGS